MSNTATQTGDRPLVYDMDGLVTDQELAQIKKYIRSVKRDRRTLVIAPRFDGNGGLYMSLTATAKELKLNDL